MRNSFLNSMLDNTNEARTENNAKAFKTSKSAMLDFFGLGGALRNTSKNTALQLFDQAWGEDAELALKAMFYFRDVRGGQGQRQAFRDQLVHLVHRGEDDVVAHVMKFIPEYGRWDDLYALFGTRMENAAINVMHEQLLKDIDADNPSLLAKWMKSENTSSKQSREFARRTRVGIGMTPAQYRRTLSKLRKRINVLESAISTGNWDSINYEHVPSKAMMLYRKAFMRHDVKGYQAYLDAITKGEAKVNTATLYPYEIVGKFAPWNHHWGGRGGLTDAEKQLLEAQWKQLPDYTGGGTESAIVVADISGSMYGDPMSVSVAMAIYYAERANGPFKDHFITFSDRPSLLSIKGTTLETKIAEVASADWGMNTNIKAVFDLVLKTALKNDVKPEDVPKKIYIVSDMQFDHCTTNGEASTFRAIKKEFESYGLQFPTIVFWNVDARENKQMPLTVDDRGFLAVSGLSPSLFKTLMTSEVVTPYDLMLETLNADRYAQITLPR